MRAGKALPEARIEVRRNGCSSTVWVTASPIDVAEARVVLYLRPDDPGDRRARGAAPAEAAVDAPALRIHTLGRTRSRPTGWTWAANGSTSDPVSCSST